MFVENSIIDKYYSLIFLGISLILIIPFSNNVDATKTGYVDILYINPNTNNCGTYGGSGSLNCWDALVNVHNLHPRVPMLAIVNPNNGPCFDGSTCSGPSAAYVSGITKLKNAGITVQGYVSTHYCARPLNSTYTGFQNTSPPYYVEGYVDHWFAFYPNIDGIMFDEMQNTEPYTCQTSGSVDVRTYYNNLKDYVHNKGGTIVSANPGAAVPSDFVGKVDGMHIYESSGTPSLGTLSTRTFYPSYDKSNFSYISYGVNSLDTTFEKSSATYVGWLFITPDTLPNPYDTLPPYLLQEVAALDSNGTSPQAPTGLTTPTQSTSQIIPRWNSVTGAIWYLLSRESPIDGGFSQIINTTSLTYSDTGRTAGTQYNYEVFAGNSSGTSVNASAESSNYTSQVAPTNISFSLIGPHTARISWTNPSGNETGFKIERESPVGGGWSTLVANTNNQTNHYDQTGLSPSTQYNIRVSTIYTGANISTTPSTPNNFTTTSGNAPMAPTGLTTPTQSTTKINLRWNASTGATWYLVWRESPIGGGFSQILNTSSLSYSNTGLTIQTQYNYKVFSGNSSGTGGASSTSANYTFGVPTQPTSLSATPVSSSQINLLWTAPSNSFGNAINGYKIERVNACIGSWNVIVSNTTNTLTSYSNTGLTNSTCYKYRVSAYNIIGLGSPSSNATATTNGNSPPVPPSPDKIACNQSKDQIWSAAALIPITLVAMIAAIIKDFKRNQILKLLPIAIVLELSLVVGTMIVAAIQC